MSTRPVCQYFNTARGCKHGANCRDQHVDQNNDAARPARRRDDRPPRPARPTAEDRAAYDTVIEILQPGVAAVVDLADASPLVTDALLRIPALGGNDEVKNNNMHQLLALDFHGVTDLCGEEEPLTIQQESSTTETTTETAAAAAAPPLIAVVSYVGAFGDIRGQTRESLKRRIQSGQINCAVLVFKKLRAADVAAHSGAAAAGGGAAATTTAATNTNDDDAAFFTASKRHAVELLMTANQNVQRCWFVDDGRDNVVTVASTAMQGVESAHFGGRTGDALRDFLKGLMNGNNEAQQQGTGKK